MRKADLSSLCQVFTTRRNGPQKGVSEGVGTFVSPRHILTALHCVRGAKHIEIVSMEGRVTQARIVRPVAQSVTMDVAIVDLLVPIGASFSKMPQGQYQGMYRCMLKTIFDNKASAHGVVGGSMFEGNQQDQTQSPIIDFSTTVEVIPGYSGSPIVAADGETVVSVTSQHIADEQAYLKNIVLGLEKVSGLGLLDKLPFISFRGANPRLFHDWAQKAATHLKLG